MDRRSRARAALTVLATLGSVRGALAQDAPADPSAATPPAPAASTTTDVEPPSDENRTKTIVPKAAVPPKSDRVRFEADPIADGAIILGSLSFAGLLEAIISTGELTPQQIPKTFQSNELLGIDRGAISQQTDSNAAAYSTVGLGLAVAFAGIDPLVTGFREHDAQSALVDAAIYAESLSLSFALTDLAKVAIRRPRPQAYIDAAAHANDPSYSNTSTDSTLSFFSGHAAITAAAGATATYLAFARSPGTARPWITLIAAAALSTFVSVERVRAGAHFPTDVIAGTMAGAGVGVVVPHLHRADDVKERPVWIGFTPASGERGNAGGVLNVSGRF